MKKSINLRLILYIVCITYQKKIMSKEVKKGVVPKRKNQPPKYVYFFGGKETEGEKDMKNLLGGKGANLAEMANIGIPVPPGFTITTEVCTYFYANKYKYPNSINNQVERAITKLEKATGKKFGDTVNPLLISVRSGARASMPGMMDTILNLGLNDKTVESLAKKTGNARFAYDCYRRFIAMYGDVVLGLKPETKEDEDPFEVIIEAKKKELKIKFDNDFTAKDLEALCREFKAAIKKKKKVFPQDPKEQLWGAINAVFSSWMNERAIIYRKMNDIPEEWGTAVNIQAMVFGNMGEDSGTGVAFTRDAATGENYFYGEFLMNAQGEDVVAGTRTPGKITELEAKDPQAYKELCEYRLKLEKHYRDMMDVEFTIEKGKLWMLQCRVGKRTAMAAMKMAVDMVEEGLITPDEALRRIEPATITQLLRPVFDANEKKIALEDKSRFLAKGLNAGPGAATGKVVFNAEDAAEWRAKGEKVILVRIETSPEDIKGMEASEGILTARGGMTSHAALVARQMGKVCVAGCGTLNIDYKSKTIKVDGVKNVVKEGDYVSIDGDTGEVMRGEIKTKPSEVVQALLENNKEALNSETYKIFKQIMDWADEFRVLKIRTNADQPDQASNAVAFGAEGIGLCRTEHMFFGEGKIGPMREMILAKTKTDREKALSKLLPLQRKDFEGIFIAMNGRPVTIRTIDPPLHEFLPQNDKEQKEMSQSLGITQGIVADRVNELHEANPMLGFRGCRLGIIYPEITEMQARAIFEAAVNVKKRKIEVQPEIMIPLVGNVLELKSQAEIVHRVAEKVMAEKKTEFNYLVGTMIEVPRGAITAGEIAKVAEFFSFGTNDLTQTTLGVSRDDSGRFLPEYVKRDIYAADPFVSIDQAGVGFLMRHAVAEGRKTRSNIKLGICGEHGGDPSSVEFCHNIGLAYVSCSPFRVPIAKVAAAKAAIADPAFKKDIEAKVKAIKATKKNETPINPTKKSPTKSVSAKKAEKKSIAPTKFVSAKQVTKKSVMPVKSAKPAPAKKLPTKLIPAKKVVAKKKK